MNDDAITRLERVMQTGFETLADLQRETNARLDAHENILVDLAGEVRGLNARFDNFLTGEHKKDHDALWQRLERVERHLGLEPEPSS